MSRTCPSIEQARPSRQQRTRADGNQLVVRLYGFPSTIQALSAATFGRGSMPVTARLIEVRREAEGPM